MVVQFLGVGSFFPGNALEIVSTTQSTSTAKTNQRTETLFEKMNSNKNKSKTTKIIVCLDCFPYNIRNLAAESLVISGVYVSSLQLLLVRMCVCVCVSLWVRACFFVSLSGYVVEGCMFKAI